MLLTMAVHFSASADRFYLKSTDLKPGETETLQFILENTEEYYGFQAEVTLPAGIQGVKGNDGELAISLSNRANDGKFRVNSNETAGGNLIMGAFSANHRPFTGNDGVLVNLNVSVSDDFVGGIVKISNVMFVNSQNKDVEFESTSFGLTVKGITLNKTDLLLTEGETAALTATIAISGTTDKTVTWSSSNESVATVDGEGNVTAVGAGTTTITVTCGAVSATCEVTVVEDISMGDSDGNGVVDANDVVVMLNYYLGVIDNIDFVVSDLNNDGVVDSQDALATSNIYLETIIK